MIEIEAVQPTAKEFRAVTRGWGVIHWIYLVPLTAYPIGFLIFGLLAMQQDGDQIHADLFAVMLIATAVVWAFGNWVVRRAAIKAQRTSPTGSQPWLWRIDAEGFVFDNGLQRNALNWRGVKAVREEKDRFLFLVTPGYNPVLPTRLLTPDQTVELRALIDEVTKSGRLGAGLAA